VVGSAARGGSARSSRGVPGLAEGLWFRPGLAEARWVGRALRRDCGVAVPGCVIVLVTAACVKGAFGVAGAIFDP
jgi:hypothetical protein